MKDNVLRGCDSNGLVCFAKQNETIRKRMKTL